jgi:hypothetical protein
LPTHVIACALLRVREDLVGVGDLFEPLLGVFGVVDVGVKFSG